MSKPIKCFKAYDVRGRFGEDLTEEAAFRIGRAYALYLKPDKVAVGGDVRLSSEPLKKALTNGLRSAGANVLDLGMTGTEEIYFAVFSQKLDGGIEVTGSHNPKSDNGLKFVREGARPISGDTGLFEIQRLAESVEARDWPLTGGYEHKSYKRQYIDHLMSYIDTKHLPPLKIVANLGNGAAGPVLNLLEARLASVGAKVEFIKICEEPDGSFPNGVPNPLLAENRTMTTEAVGRHKADLGLAWDGDFDRCFFFDENGCFIEGYYIVGLLAKAFLEKKPHSVIIHDPRLTWNTIDIVKSAGGRPVQSKTGHAFIKERMRAEEAVYGGEMSAHHYFKDFAYCDSGMIPWLLILELMGRKQKNLSELVSERQEKFPCSGEINYRVSKIAPIFEAVETRYAPEALKVEKVDGLSMEMPNWRFNLRGSNTEPLLRLNLETLGDRGEVTRRVEELEKIIKSI